MLMLMFVEMEEFVVFDVILIGERGKLVVLEVVFVLLVLLEGKGVAFTLIFCEVVDTLLLLVIGVTTLITVTLSRHGPSYP